MSRPKSRITVSRRQDGVAIRATGVYAQALVEALFGKISEEAPQASQPPEGSEQEQLQTAPSED